MNLKIHHAVKIWCDIILNQSDKITKKGVIMLKPEETIIEIKNERQMKAISGVTESQLKLIATEFEIISLDEMVHFFLEIALILSILKSV